MQPTNEKSQEMEKDQETTEKEDEIVREPVEELLLKAQQERDEYLDMAQRIKAEFENFRRRNSSVRTDAYEDGVRETFAAFLPVIDNLERALETNPEKSAFSEGIELVYKQILDMLDKYGVSVINRLGEPFDPELENAIAQADVGEGSPGTVATVLQKGYRTEDRVIRHAMVRVVPAG